MFELLAIVVLLFGYYSLYIISLYSLAVNIDPEDVRELLPDTSDRRRAFLMRLSSEPRAFMQIAAVYKSLALIMITLSVLHLIDTAVPFDGWIKYAVIGLALFCVWLLNVVFGEYLPRRASRAAMGPAMLRYLWLLRPIFAAIYPVYRTYSNALKSRGADSLVTEEEKEEIVERAIESLADQAGIGEAIVEEEEREMIGHILTLDQTVAREIMVPRIDITGIEKSSTFREIRELVLKDGHSRFPVYEETIDKLVGILYVKDLFSNMPEAGEKFVIGNYLRKPYFIPESKNVADLLKEFKARKLHIAIVVDEYGGVSGLVTLEDILEEIVGEIQDEHDAEEAEITRISENSYVVDAGLLVEELQDYLDTEYQQGDYDTVGGLIYDLVGSVPRQGTTIKWHDIDFDLLHVEGQRIMRVKVTRHPGRRNADTRPA